MIPQGFPLYATDDARSTYAVVGWEETPTDERWPVLVRLGGPSASGAFSTDGRDLLTFTTERSTPGDANAMAYEVADLRRRLSALADSLQDAPDAVASNAGRLIRSELDK